MSIPPHLSFVTLGVRDLPRLRRFYADLGWDEVEGSDDTWASFELGGVKLALYPVALLQAEAAPDARPPVEGRWSGVTLAINLPDRAAVDRAQADALAAGATAVAAPTDREWGGYSGYMADPEGNRWELAWAPPA